MGKFTIINEGNKLPSLEGCCLNQEGWAWVDKDSGQKTKKVSNDDK